MFEAIPYIHRLGGPGRLWMEAEGLLSNMSSIPALDFCNSKISKEMPLAFKIARTYQN